MKKTSIFIIVFFLSFFITSCDRDFEKLNTDPNNPTSVPSHLLIANTVFQNQNILYGLTASTNEMGMCWIQQMSKVEYNDEERYDPRRSSIDAIWSGLYINVLAETKEMERLAIEENNKNIQGIALVLRANAFEIATDMFGPIPFTEALDQKNTKPKYDNEQTVHEGIISMLTSADLLFASNVGVVPSSSDLVFRGDIAKWKKLANALKLKALMRISKAPGATNIASRIQNLVSSGGLMTSTSDTAQINYLAAQPDANPIYETIVFGARPEYKVASPLVNKLTTLNDPRLAVYAQKNNANLFVGNVPGTKPTNAAAFSSLGTFYLSPTLPGIIMSFEHQQLLLAEAANEGFITGGLTAAKNYYLSGVSANLALNGISNAAITSYLGQSNIDFATSNDAKLRIGEQLWIALYTQGFEAWSEWRRTGVPVLTPLSNGFQTSIPKRFYYSTTEVSLNNANYSSALSLLNFGDKMTSKLWWGQ